jgi:hypothetical protein
MYLCMRNFAHEFMVCDYRSREIVVAFRGSQELADMVTCKFSCPALPVFFCLMYHTAAQLLVFSCNYILLIPLVIVWD